MLLRGAPFDDFDVNAVGTLKLGGSEERCPDAPFLFLSTKQGLR